MKGKTQSAYRAIFKALQMKWNDLGVEPKFKKLQTDFEAAQMNAISEVFGKEKALELD